MYIVESMQTWLFFQGDFSFKPAGIPNYAHDKDQVPTNFLLIFQSPSQLFLPNTEVQERLHREGGCRGPADGAQQGEVVQQQRHHGVAGGVQGRKECFWQSPAAGETVSLP